MTKAILGTVEELDRKGRLNGRVGDKSVGVFRTEAGLVAYEDHCPHQGGPVCIGKVFKRVEASVEDGEVVERFSQTDLVLTCPWHGYEFDLDDGVCRIDPRYRLKSLDVSIEGADVVVES